MWYMRSSTFIIARAAAAKSRSVVPLCNPIEMRPTRPRPDFQARTLEQHSVEDLLLIVVAFNLRQRIWGSPPGIEPGSPIPGAIES